MFQASYILLWITVAVLSVAVLFLGRQIGLLYQRVGPAGARMANPGPELNSSIEQTVVQDIDGNSVTIGGRRSRQSLIAFVTPGCTSCAELVPAIRAIAHHERSTLDVFLVSFGLDVLTHQEFRSRYNLSEIPYVVSHELRLKLNITAVPYGLALDSEGTLRSKGIVNSQSHLESLLNMTDAAIAYEQERAAAPNDLAQAPTA